MQTAPPQVRGNAFYGREAALNCARTLGPLLRRNAAKADEIRRVPEESIEAIHSTGLFNLMTPKRFGGSELGLDALLAAGSGLAEYCGSTAWVYEVLAGHNWLVSLFPFEAQEEIFTSSNPLTASCTRAAGDVRRTDAGVMLQNVKGRFCSGIDHAGWIALGASVQDDSKAEQCFVIVPTDGVKILDDWHTSGMRGTGSKSFAIEQMFVPACRVLPISTLVAGKAPGFQVNSAAIYRAPFPQILPFQLAGVPLGLARAALSTFVDVRKAAMTGMPATELGEHTPTYLLISDAAADIDAAHALVERNCHLIDEIGEPESLSPLNRTRYVRDVAWCVQTCRAAVNRLYEASGGSGIYETHPMQRIWRDINAAASHAAFVPERGGTMFGRAMLGLPPSPRYQIGQ